MHLHFWGVITATAMKGFFFSIISVGYLVLKNRSWENMNAWRNIPVGKWLVTPIYMPFRPFEQLLRWLINRGYKPLTSPGMTLEVDPPSCTGNTLPSEWYLKHQEVFGLKSSQLQWMDFHDCMFVQLGGVHGYTNHMGQEHFSWL